MMDNFSSFNTVNISKEKAFIIALQDEQSRDFSNTHKNIAIGLSSGTSGNRGLFITNDKERALWAGTILAKTLPYSILKKTSIGLFLRANNKLYETINSKHISFSFFDLQKPFDELLTQLNNIKPKILVAPPSALRMIAENNLSYCPEKVISCAEALEPIDEEFLSHAFEQTIHQIYQCTEGFLAHTCISGHLHLNEDLVLIEKEYIDAQRFIPIITDLYRTSQPIIRYRLNDILIENKHPCQCHSHYLRLDKIEGRCDDVLYFKNRTGNIKPLFPDFIRRQLILASEDITDYQVIQKDLEHLAIYISPNINIKPHIEKYLEDQGLQVPAIKLLSSPLERRIQDKKRRIIRQYEL
jgi:putative adenylate-forming enzyme